jgi:hypothetical protein
MHEVTLRRTGQDDLSFRGKLMAKVQNPDPDGHQFRQLKLSLYQSQAGKYVLGLSRQARTPGADQHVVLCFGACESVFEFLDQPENIAGHLLSRLRRLTQPAERPAVPAAQHRGRIAA